MIDEKVSTEARTILIAEDSSVQAEQLKYILEKNGYTVVVAVDGLEAAEQAQKTIPDLIISDIIMPRMNGYELCKAIKANKLTCKIPLILLTSLSDSNDLIEGMASGASHFLTKPFREDYLISQMKQIFLNTDLYSTSHKPVTMELMVGGEKRSITTDPQQMLTLLVSSYNAAIYRNDELTKSREELRNINDRLEDLVDERTQELHEEIEERKKVQEELLQSISMTEATLESTIDGILVVGHDGNILKTNKRFIELFNIPEEVLTSRVDEKVIDYVQIQTKYPEDFLKKVQYLYQHPFEESFDFIEFKDGRVYERYSRPQTIGQEVVGRVWSFRDVTERKNAEANLKESEQRVELAVKSSDLGMWDLSISKGTLWRTKRFDEIFGYGEGKEGWLPEKILAQILPDDVELVKQNYEKALKTGKLYIECRISRASGDVHWISVYGKTQYNDKNVPVRMLGTIQDITDRKFNELKIEIANNELQKANADKDRLFSIIAHDLRSPFNGFIGLTKIMLENAQELKPSELLEISKRLNDSAKNIYKLLENLLEWSLVQKQKGNFDPQSFNLYPVVTQNIEVIKEKALQKGISVVNKINRELWVIGDMRMVNTVIRNLLSNAIKFTKGGGTITLDSSLLQGNMVEVAVKDTGMGMTQDQMNGLFVSAGSGGSKGTEGEKSTGLGLILCKEFTEQNGGKLRVESREGVGSDFFFSLPVDASKIDEQAGIKNEDVAVDNKKHKLIILIAEDDEASQMLLKLAVKSFGKEILIANNGVEAVEICRSTPGIDLVLMDIKMPLMDGGEATQLIREFNKDLIIVAQSAYIDNSNHEIILKMGFTDVIAKPINIRILHQVIKRYFAEMNMA